MAYADKCTTMRRCVVIGENGNGMIIWEGVNIEGTLILKEVSNNNIKIIPENEFENFNEPKYWGEWLLIYQDKEEDSFWCPRDMNCNWDEENKKWVVK